MNTIKYNVYYAYVTSGRRLELDLVPLAYILKMAKQHGPRASGTIGFDCIGALAHGNVFTTPQGTFNVWCTELDVTGTEAVLNVVCRD